MISITNISTCFNVLKRCICLEENSLPTKLSNELFPRNYGQRLKQNKERIYYKDVLKTIIYRQQEPKKTAEQSS